VVVKSFGKKRIILQNSCILWDIKPCRQLKVYQRSGRKCRLYLQGRRIIEACTEQSRFATCFMLAFRFTYSSTLTVEETRFSEIFITFAVRTLNPSYTAAQGSGMSPPPPPSCFTYYFSRRHLKKGSAE
jgi:hypothetical protein